jgi:xanthine phosphoribosyltransferase
MKALKDRIIADGVAIGTEIVKVDSFLNHQIDVALLDEIGQEFS